MLRIGGDFKFSNDQLGIAEASTPCNTVATSHTVQ